MPQTNKIKKPTLRFPEFSGAWEAFSLLKLSQNGFSNGVFNDPLKVGRGYKLINVKDMYLETYINESELTLVDIDNNEFHRNQVEPGDIFFTRSSLVKEGIARSNVFLGKSGNVTFDGHLIRMRPDRQYVLPIFLNYLLKTQYIRKQLVVRGNTTTMTTIGQKEISEVIAIIPQITEQQKIASFLTSVDDWIENLKKQKEAQEKYKKGMMQKIFSQEIRFKDEDGKDYSKWEEKRLGEVAELFKGEGVSKQDIKNNGKYKCIRYGELYTLYSEQIKEVLSRTDIPFKRRSANNDVLMPTSDVTPTGLATASALSEENIILGGDILVIRSKRINNIFFSYYIGANKRDVMRLVNGVTVYHLYGSDMEKMNIKVPRFEEQQKIADFLSSIDDLINLSNQRITQAEEWKKGLMQRVFV